VETKDQRFKRLASARTNKVLDTLDLIGNLSNENFYKYSEKEVQEIFEAIIESANKNKEKFNKKKRNKRRFTL